MVRKILTFLILSLCVGTANFAQAPKKMHSGEIYAALQKVNFLGTVLYVAAHPDDENTRMISYFANEVHANTYYLSLTRGDGGQNLIGPEIGPLLGIIRTQELMEARKVDGGKQMFSRANDFGFSKNAEETIRIWDSEKVKEDVVWAIRNIRPDIIINRFDHRTSGTTHGHHTASGMLTHELFESAGREDVFPMQLKYHKPWKAERLFFNTSWWFYGSQENFAKADKSNLISVDLGTFFPLLGKSNTEIAAISRSKHKCQGFGTMGARGIATEYLELLKGNMPTDKSNPFEGINTTWSRVKNGAPIQKLMDEVIAGFDFRAPERSLPKLMEVYRLIQNLDDPYWKSLKSAQIMEVIEGCAGLFLEAVSSTPLSHRGEEIKVDLEVISRSAEGIKLVGVSIRPALKDTVIQGLELLKNEKWLNTQTIVIPENMPYSDPYWLRKPGTTGMYDVEDQTLIGLPETARPIQVEFSLEVLGQILKYTKNLVYKSNSPELGEVYRPFEVLPEAFVQVKEKVVVFGDQSPKEIQVEVKSIQAGFKGQLILPVANGWAATPAFQEVELKEKGESQTFKFLLTPPRDASEIIINPVVIADNGARFDKALQEISYEHIPHQIVLLPSESRAVRINILRKGQKIAYLMGAGDEVPTALQQIGYQVDMFVPQDISAEKLKSYDALIIGVRAYNKWDELKFKQKDIFAYAEAGGNVIVQYQVNRGLVTNDLLPYSIKLSRDRVTLEDAEMRILNPKHRVLTTPNKIDSKDFEKWVQERGLYFAGEWSKEFEPIFSCNDDGEPERLGSLLIAPYGKGFVSYTGLSWFRQLPAGVPGAYRIFANLIALNQKS